MSRDELAESVALWIAARDSEGRTVAFDGGHVGKLERGAVRRLRDYYVAALCAVLGGTEAELGFTHQTSPVANDTNSALRLPDGAQADTDYIESLDALIKRLAELDGMHGGADVAPIALRCFRRAQRVLGEGRYPHSLERDLEAVTAELGELAGWLLFDAERHDESRLVNTEALTLARIAGDMSIEWFVLTNQAHASVHTGRHREALRISKDMTCDKNLPGRVRALFDVRAARALAGLGDGATALRTFDRARSRFLDGTTARDPAWSWWFDERELAGHEGMIHAVLGNHRRALPNLEMAVERSEGREQFRWALYVHRANLLRATLAAESWHEAERTAVAIAPMVGEISSSRTEGILRQTVTRFEGVRRHLPSTLSDTLEYISKRLAADG
jgi:hypothetical protein